jgi:inosose dehydratase
MDKSDAGNYSFKESVLEGIFTVPGDEEGCIEFESIFEVLAEADYEGWLMVEAEQDPARATPLVYAKMGRQYIRDVTGI